MSDFSKLNGYDVKDAQAREDIEKINLEKISYFENIQELRNATNLQNGEVVKTLGYYNINDKGEAFYYIRNKTVDDTDNGGNIIVINNLVAELISDKKVNVKVFGVVGNGTTDDTTQLNHALQYTRNKTLVLNNENYAISEPLDFTNQTIEGDINTSIIALSTFIGNYMLIPHEDVHIKKIKFDAKDYVICIIGESTDNTSIKIEDCIFKGVKENANDNFAFNSAIYLTAKDSILLNSIIEENYSHGCRLMTYFNNATAHIENCKFINNGKGIVACGLVQYGRANGSKYDKVTISKCYATGNNNTGIAPHSCYNIIISDCVSNENGEHGFCLMDGENGIITNSIALDNAKYGVRIQGDYTNNVDPGYNDFEVTNNKIRGGGIDLGYFISNGLVANNLIEYEEIEGETAKGIKIAKDNEEAIPFENVAFINNKIYGYSESYEIMSFVELPESVEFYNHLEHKNHNSYSTPSWFDGLSCKKLKYGESNNIVNNPTDFSSGWTINGTVVGNTITPVSEGVIAWQTIDVTNLKRYISLFMGFNDLPLTDKLSIGLRFRNSSNSLMNFKINGSTTNQLAKQFEVQGNTLCRLVDLTKLTDINIDDIKKIDIFITGNISNSITMRYCYASLTNDVPVIPN